MKPETKNMLNRIIAAYDRRLPEDSEKAKCFNKTRDEIQAFLRSIPDMEKHLTEGGYIQDRNGTPICHGDTIKLCNPYFYEGSPDKAYRYAVLNWNPRVAKFEVIYENDDQSVATADLSIFTPQMLEKKD